MKPARTVVLALSALLITGCGESEPAVGPGETVQAYFDSLAAGDQAGACEMLSDDAQEGEAECAAPSSEEDETSSTVGDVLDDFEVTSVDVSEDGETATVTTTLATGLEGIDDLTYDFGLAQVDDEWKIVELP